MCMVGKINAVKFVMKPSNCNHFQFFLSKKLILNKSENNILVQAEVNCRSENGMAKSILKQGMSITTFQLILIITGVPVIEAKRRTL